MTREEILEKSRAENKNQDEWELAVLNRAGNLGFAVGGLICSLLLVMNVIFDDVGSNLSIWMVYMAMSGTVLLVKFVKLRKTHELVFGILESLMAVAFFVLYIIWHMR